MSQVQRHYDDLLATHYSWMSGMSFSDKVTEQRKLLEDIGFRSGSEGLAIDLGCGPGYQTAALCDLGYAPVIAIDTSRALLDEMAVTCHDRPVHPVLADLRDFPSLVEAGSAAAIICMGDTLTHLENRADIVTLVQDAYCNLRPGGRLALTFRDYSVELTGTDRFIPVRSDDRRIMTCALLYERDHVVVNDLVHVRSDAGWSFHKSSYRKLRLAPSFVSDALRQAGFSILFDAPVDRMRAIVARKS